MLFSLIVLGFIPLAAALRAHRKSSLFHALIWASVAWAAWGVAFLLGSMDEPGLEPARFVALTLTACAGIAVLGARRPIVGAWNFVVLGLLAVLLLPLIESLFLGMPSADWLRILFLSATIFVIVLNYLPTRLGPAALGFLIACAGELIGQFAPTWLASLWMPDGLLTLIPWIAFFETRKLAHASEFDRLWLHFRDSWGLMWSQRVREQFNLAAQNAGWPVRLKWTGLRYENVEAGGDELYLNTLRAILQRFVDQR